MLNIYIDNSDIKSQINVIIVTLERDLRYIMYISIDKTFTVYMMKLQNLIMTMSIINIVKMMNLKL